MARGKQLFRLAGLLCLFITLVACEKDVPDKVEAPRPIKMLTITGQSSDTFLEYPGKISAAQEAELAFEVSGQIIKLPVKEGQAVKRGELIAKIDARDYQSNLLSAQSRFDAAKANFQRAQDLIKKDYISKADYDKLKAASDDARARLSKSKKALADTELRAPFTGEIVSRVVENFTNIQAKQAVAVLHDQSSLEVDISIPEQDWRLAKPGLSIEERQARSAPKVTVSAFPGRQFPAVIKELSTVAEPTTRTFSAAFSFASPKDIVILPGMTAKVSLTLVGRIDSDQSIRVPASAVGADTDGAPFVWVVDTGAMSVTRRKVVVGELQGVDVEIQSGLKFKETVAVSGINQLREGMVVTDYKSL
jgi:RND family efflux transporter MFP subunit